MKVTKFAQSTFSIEHSRGKRLLIDPGSYNFDNGFQAKDFGIVDVLVITHKHADHFDLKATKTIVDLHNPIIVTNPEVAMLLQKESIRSRSWQIGDALEIDGFDLRSVRTDHVVRDETIVNFGLTIRADEKRIYHTSDTRLIELNLLPQDQVMMVDLLCLPIGNRGVVMGIDDALYFANELRPKAIVPMHYDSPKDKDRILPEHFEERLKQLGASLENLLKTKVVVLRFGDQMELL